MQRLVILFLALSIFSCSSEQTTRSKSNQSSKSKNSIEVATQPNKANSAPLNFNQNRISNGVDSLANSGETNRINGMDTSGRQALTELVEEDTEVILQRLEQARQRYLIALASQELGDTVSCGEEFEAAIQILNELGEYTSIDSSKDYMELSKSVIEDYEKYIAQIDSLGPEASVYALREKLNQIVEQGGFLDVKVPRFEIKGTVVPLPFNEYVGRATAFFMGRGRQHMERWLYLSGKYFPMMKRIFIEEEVPEELIIVSMPESGLRTDARSWAKAVGLWQFMKGTGSLYGLRVNWWIDERRDFEKSTRAAARHLKDLYTEFRDWNLALGSYNAGAGRIFRGMRRSGSTDFWEMRKYLPRETRNYIPQYIAVARIVLNPEKHGFTNFVVSDSLMYDVVEINDCVDLRVLAKCAITTVDTLQDLNPELLRWCTPPGVTGYKFRIPYGRKEIFLNNYEKIPEEQKKDWALHTIKKGETVFSVAKKYGLTTTLIKEVNNLRSDRKLSIGTVLAIPIPRDVVNSKVAYNYSPEVRGMNFGAVRAYVEKVDATKSKAKKIPKELTQPRGKGKLIYIVKRGDTIGHIAEWYGVRASDIRNWNDIAYGEHIYSGQSITIWVASNRVKQLMKINELEFSQKQAMLKGDFKEAQKAETEKTRVNVSSTDWIQHIVKAGETLEKIANMYEVRISDLKQWNNLKTSKIFVGQSLDIYDKPEARVKIITSASKSNPSRTVKTQSTGIFSPTHKVKKGETIYSIAKMYDVDIQKLKKHNNLNNNKIVVGQVLRIPSKSI